MNTLAAASCDAQLSADEERFLQNLRTLGRNHLLWIREAFTLSELLMADPLKGHGEVSITFRAGHFQMAEVRGTVQARKSL